MAFVWDLSVTDKRDSEMSGSEGVKLPFCDVMYCQQITWSDSATCSLLFLAAVNPHTSMCGDMLLKLQYSCCETQSLSLINKLCLHCGEYFHQLLVRCRTAIIGIDFIQRSQLCAFTIVNTVDCVHLIQHKECFMQTQRQIASCR